ncbi:hypothetical protein GX586_09070 [bacterium]|nr:hypothetical protein [bacterium]
MNTHWGFHALCLAVFSALLLMPGNATAKCPPMGYHQLHTNELYMGISLISLLWGGECFTDSERTSFMNDYGRSLSRFCGPDVHLVAATPTGERTFALTCRSGDGATSFRVDVSLVCNEADKIESVMFSRDVTLPGGVSVRRDQPVPLETIMHATAFDRRARLNGEAQDLEVKALKSSLSCRKPAADGLKGKTIVRGSAPTGVTTFRAVSNIWISAYIPGTANVLEYTFTLDNWGIGGKGGHVDMIYAGQFHLVPDLGYTKPVALFNARINKGRVYFDFKLWTVNPSNGILSQAQYEGMRKDFETNTPIRGVGRGAVIFGMDGEAHAVTNLPVSIKTSTAGYKAKSAKMNRRGAKRALHA